jgi:hypothetical protein
MFRTVTSVALALSSILGSAAVARVDEVPTQIVHFADLDLIPEFDDRDSKVLANGGGL